MHTHTHQPIQNVTNDHRKYSPLTRFAIPPTHVAPKNAQLVANVAKMTIRSLPFSFKQF